REPKTEPTTTLITSPTTESTTESTTEPTIEPTTEPTTTPPTTEPITTPPTTIPPTTTPPTTTPPTTTPPTTTPPTTTPPTTTPPTTTPLTTTPLTTTPPTTSPTTTPQTTSTAIVPTELPVNIPRAQHLILAEVFFKLYKDLIDAYKKNGVTNFPPLSCQSIVTDHQFCFVCPPQFGILKLFETRCTWIPHAIANADGFVNERKFDILAKDVYTDLRNMYRKLRTNGPEQLDEAPETVGVASHDVPLITNSFGTFKDLNVDDAHVKIIATFATTALQAIRDYKRLVLNQVIKAQVMAGRNFKLTLQLANFDANGYPGKSLVCVVVVFVHPTIETRELVSHSCSVAPKKLVASHNETDIVNEILLAIKERKDLSQIGHYLNASRDCLVKDLPLTSPNGTKLSYVFFAHPRSRPSG
ncbi:uncharacterized protein LOC123470413, partial [Daphnia magna]|uniref:uncharacterized protein LOC123470413 n=1 Tax=Daphnia magna TaxID=35525 RepID=UPI001E1BBBD7